MYHLFIISFSNSVSESSYQLIYLPFLYHLSCISLLIIYLHIISSYLTLLFINLLSVLSSIMNLYYQSPIPFLHICVSVAVYMPMYHFSLSIYNLSSTYLPSYLPTYLPIYIIINFLHLYTYLFIL